MSGAVWQWIAVGAVVALAVAGLARKLRRDPCAGCDLASTCAKKKRKKQRHT